MSSKGAERLSSKKRNKQCLLCLWHVFAYGLLWCVGSYQFLRSRIGLFDKDGRTQNRQPIIQCGTDA